MSAVIILILRFFAALSLYAFLGFIIFTLWKELDKTDKKYDGNLATQIIIKDLSKGESLDFREKEIFIGRDELAQIKLLHDEAVSNFHARIFHKSGNIWIEDLQSTNGTFLNGEPIITPTIVVSGDQITCGKTTIEITKKNNLHPTEI